MQAQPIPDRALATTPRRAGLQLLPFLGKYSIFFSLLIVGVVLTVLTRGLFISSNNLTNMLVASTDVMIVATGMTFIIIAGGIDLSVGATAALAGMICGAVIKTPGVNVYVGMASALLVGIVVGAINGTLIAYARVPNC